MSDPDPLDRSILGTCPHCDAMIPEAEMLIRYERKGRRSVFAACPNCDQVVRPRS